MHDERELDALLDRALSSYAAAEPDGALRARITVQMAEASLRRRKMWLFGAVAACTAALTFALLIHPAAHEPMPQRTSEASISSVPKTRPADNESNVKLHPRAVPAAQSIRQSRRRPTLLRVKESSTPVPPTYEEWTLLKFTSEHPEQARQVLTAIDQQRLPLETKPLSIAPIHIAALSNPEQHSED